MITDEELRALIERGEEPSQQTVEKQRFVSDLWYGVSFFSCASPVEQKSIDGGSSSTSLLPDLNLDNGIEIVTWNIENFPKLGSRTIDSVYNVFTSLNADVYCLQEISNRNSFQELTDRLIDYDYVISDDTDYLNLALL